MSKHIGSNVLNGSFGMKFSLKKNLGSCLNKGNKLSRNGICRKRAGTEKRANSCGLSTDYGPLLIE